MGNWDLNDNDKELYSHLRSIILEEKAKQHLTNSNISEMTGVSRSILVNFLNGKTEYMAFHNVLKILSYLNTAPVYFNI